MLVPVVVVEIVKLNVVVRVGEKVEVECVTVVVVEVRLVVEVIVVVVTVVVVVLVRLAVMLVVVGTIVWQLGPANPAAQLQLNPSG